jgi:phosphatidylethanolamine/phosphatidyl-N-methylethanolamine N-methyltransferase
MAAGMATAGGTIFDEPASRRCHSPQATASEGTTSGLPAPDRHLTRYVFPSHLKSLSDWIKKMKYPAVQKLRPGWMGFAAQGLTNPFRDIWNARTQRLSPWIPSRSNWRVTGAIAPSSPRLSASLASLAVGADHVLELGAGSGAVTRELLKVFPMHRLCAVELQPRLASGLKRSHPALDVFEGSADLALDKHRTDGVAAVVSSLPFRSLPAHIREQTVQSVCRYLTASPGSRFIQFTYGFRQPFDVGPGFHWVRVKWVLENLPPACIWVLTAAVR